MTDKINFQYGRLNAHPGAADYAMKMLQQKMAGEGSKIEDIDALVCEVRAEVERKIKKDG